MTDFLTQIINTSKRRSRYKDLRPHWGDFKNMFITTLVLYVKPFLIIFRGRLFDLCEEKQEKRRNQKIYVVSDLRALNYRVLHQITPF